jgi:uncharacterized membrane protein YkvA (DUF1232 family)
MVRPMRLRDFTDRLRRWARRLRIDAHALYLAARDPRVPWTAKLVAAAVAAYVFSPIDLIPDFVPVLGFLDELVIVPLGIRLALLLIPADIMLECRDRAAAIAGRPVSRAAAAAIVTIWILLALLIASAFLNDAF